MKSALVTVTRVTGTCNAGYQMGDQIVVNLDTACINKEQSDNLCIFALSAILASIARIKPGEQALASCPDPATGIGGNVIFHIAVKEEP